MYQIEAPLMSLVLVSICFKAKAQQLAITFTLF